MPLTLSPHLQPARGIYMWWQGCNRIALCYLESTPSAAPAAVPSQDRVPSPQKGAKPSTPAPAAAVSAVEGGEAASAQRVVQRKPYRGWLLPHGVTCSCITYDGTMLAFGLAEGSVVVWDDQFGEGNVTPLMDETKFVGNEVAPSSLPCHYFRWSHPHPPTHALCRNGHVLCPWDASKAPLLLCRWDNLRCRFCPARGLIHSRGQAAPLSCRGPLPHGGPFRHLHVPRWRGEDGRGVVYKPRRGPSPSSGPMV